MQENDEVKLRVLGVGALVLLLLIMVSGLIGTGAWFTDQDVLAGNALAAGYLDVQLIQGGTSTTPIVLDRIEPGRTYGPFPISIYNSGSTMPIKYRFYVANAQGALLDEIEMVVAHSDCVDDPGDWTKDPSKIVYQGKVSDFYADSTNHAVGDGTLPVNSTHCWMIRFNFDESAATSIRAPGSPLTSSWMRLTRTTPLGRIDPTYI
jgi:hypothetical protein